MDLSLKMEKLPETAFKLAVKIGSKVNKLTHVHSFPSLPNEEEILDIIFLPSFSQKDQVDELSGRGVGMDIVKKNIEKIGGRVVVNSEIGMGTEIILFFKPGEPLA